ncbi:MAG TPA: DMT family transporter [Ardenticatenaceae bacterium]|jgi:drug/metabolite transporter (DMT)-like permease
MSSDQREGAALVLLAAAGYACLPILAKWAYAAGLAPLDVVTWRFILATPLIWLVLLAGRVPLRAPRLLRGRLLAVGLLFGILASTGFFALARIPSSTYTVLVYTYPAMVAILAHLLGERLERWGWAALLMTLVGVTLTVPALGVGLGQTDALGLGLALLNAALYALYIVISSHLLRGHRALAEASAWSITGSLLLFAVVAVARGLQWPVGGAALGSVFGLAILSTAIPIFAFYAGMARLGAPRASILSTVEPLFTLLLAAGLLHETMTPRQWLGGLLILVSVVLLQLRRGPAASLVQREIPDEREMVTPGPTVEDAHLKRG